MFNDDDGMSASEQCVEGFHEFLDVVEVQTGGWFVEDKQGWLYFFDAQEVGQFDTLVFTSGEGR